VLELIGLQDDLIARTCAKVLENGKGADLSSVAVVFPSRRFGFFLRQELSRKMAGNYFPPAMYPVEAFFESLFRLNFPGFRVLDELEAAHAVYESARVVFQSGMYGSKKIADFPSFLPWAQKLLEALEEIQTEGGETQGVNWKEYAEFTELGEYHKPYKEFIQKIPALLDHLGQNLTRQRQATKGMTWRKVADLAEKRELQIIPAQTWILSGFNAVNACEKKLFRFLFQERRASLILRTDPRALDDPRSPIHLQAETIAALGLERPPLDPSFRKWNDLAGRVTFHPCDGVENEAFQAFDILEKICRDRNEEGLRRVAVLLPSPPTLIPFIQGAVSRFDQDKFPVPFNITLGYPLERTPIKQLVDSMLSLLEKSYDGVIAAGDYLQVIRHPYVKVSGSDSDREPLKRGVHLLEDIINGQNLTRFTIRGLAEKLAAKIAERKEEMEGELALAIKAQVDGMHQRFIPQGITGIAALLAFLRQALESVGSEENRKAHLFLNEYAAAALEALGELEAFAASRGEALQGASVAGLTALVRSHFRGRTIRFEGTPLKGVQVMGPLEFRGLCFDEVVVLDALEGILPGMAKYDPILPADIRAIFRIRDHGDWERVYAHNFFSLLGAAGHVHILYPQKDEKGKDCERSRFIERIAYEVKKSTGSAPVPSVTALCFSIPARELTKVKKSKRIRDKLESLTLSPSSLESYVNCPLQFYFKKVLGLNEREEVSPETEGGLIGTIAHEALSVFYKKYKNAAAMDAAGSETLGGDLEKFLFAAFRAANFDPEQGLERIRAWTLRERLGKYVREDRQRMADGGIQVESLEENLSGKFQVPGRQSPVFIKGRIDRRERQGDLLRVIDYKTGGTKFSPHPMLQNVFPAEKLSSGDENEYLQALGGFRRKYQGMQLLLYLLLLAQSTGQEWDRLDGAYVLLRNNDHFHKPLFLLKDKMELIPGDKAAIMDTFRDDLGLILGDLYSREYFLADPSDDTVCKYCPFRLPCGNL
jgi:ATP-dependent helicase/nuclease subunit B